MAIKCASCLPESLGACPRSWSLIEAAQAFFNEPLARTLDRSKARLERSNDLFVGQAV